MFERFMRIFALNPNTPKNPKIINILLDYSKITD